MHNVSTLHQCRLEQQMTNVARQPFLLQTAVTCWAVYQQELKLENEMIYCLKPEMYPTPEQTIEEISYRDENDFEWKIARVENGFFVKYFGEPYFKETYFSCDLKSGEHILVNNTNCIFIQDTDFETFAEVRNVIKIGYTDDIWETFQEMFEERFEHDKVLLESELVK